MNRVRLGLATAATAALTLAAATACSTDTTTRPLPTPTESLAAPRPVHISFGAWGTEDELAAYDQIVSDFTGARTSVTVDPVTWRGPGGLVKAIEAGTAPDVFLATREQIQDLAEAEQLLPVDSFLDARRVNLGDDVYRSATEALSWQSRLVCMPFTVSGKVAFYNTDLIDFEQMAAEDLDVPGQDDAGWSQEQFWEAVAWSGHPKINIDASIRGLAPWLIAAGSSIFDRDVEPTSLTLTPGVLESLIEGVGANRVDLADPTRAFVRGRLAVLVADRSVVPALRASGVDFDALPMPGSSATSGSVDGICINATTEFPETAADLTVAFNFGQSGEHIAATGSLVPANRVAVATPVFNSQAPTNTEAFDVTATNLHPLPTGIDWDALDAAVNPYIEQLFTAGADLDELTDQINTASRVVLAPEDVEPEE